MWLYRATKNDYEIPSALDIPEEMREEGEPTNQSCLPYAASKVRTT